MIRVAPIRKSKIVTRVAVDGDKVFTLTITRRDFEVVIKALTPEQKKRILELGRECGPISAKMLALHKIMKTLEEVNGEVDTNPTNRS